jgi:chemotaxis protein methyltransferase CheR
LDSQKGLSVKIDLIVHGNTTYFNIEGIFNNTAFINKFILELENCVSEYLEIAFLDAWMLPAEIVIALTKKSASQPMQKLKVIVYFRYLSSYLSKLGIRNINQSSLGKHQYESNVIKAIVIGGSAGSLDPILAIMSKLPLADVSVFIVQHILEHSLNHLNNLISERSVYNVAVVKDGMKIETGKVYIAPPACHLIIEKGKIRLSTEDKLNYARPSISHLFDSAAVEYGNNLIAVLLCGYGSDGTSSLPILHKNKAKVIIEDPEECDAKDMLLNAWKTGLVNYKFPLPELISYLNRMLASIEPEISDQALNPFLNSINDKYGYCYSRYEKESIKRRIKHGMNELRIHSFKQFQQVVLNDDDVFEFLFLEFSINVTDLFRDPYIYKVIETDILPYIATYPYIKIWSAGCSTGQEPYSLAIKLEESGLLKKTQIYASDINPYVIEEAKNGLIPQQNLEKAKKNYLASGGSKSIDDYFNNLGPYQQLKKPVSEKILFFQHSLLNSGIFHEFQLIICRNVLIYFNKELQMQVINLFIKSLDLNGFLILGKNETFANGIPGLKLIDKSNNIYKCTN